LKGQPGRPREWIYCWYSPRGESLREMAFDQRYKLYRHGEFFDLTKDIEEQHPLSVASLTGDAAQAAKKLDAALHEFDTARPAKLPKRELAQSAAKGGKKAAKKAAKAKTAD
jgi:arylsulfatase A